MKQLRKLINSAKKQYRNIPGYYSYDAYLESIYKLYSESFGQIGIPIEQVDVESIREAERQSRLGTVNTQMFERHDYLLLQSIDDSFPVYHLNVDLAQSLSETEIPVDIPITHLFQKRGVVLFPNPDPGSGKPTTLVFSYHPQDDLMDVLLVNEQMERSPLNFSVYGDRMPRHPFFFRPNVPLSELLGAADTKQLGLFVVSEGEMHPINVVYNLFLYLQQKPTDFTEVSTDQTKENTRGRGFGKTQKQPRSPVMIGANYRIKKEAVPNGGTHASPLAHWRRGHWRNQPYGSRQNPSYKPVWIEPILVNG